MNLAIVASALLLSAGVAQAGTGLSFEEIKEACLDPGKYHNQKAPTNLQVTCEDRGTLWKPEASSTVELFRSRQVTASLTSDKYSVEPTVQSLAVEGQLAACPRYKEVMEVVNFTKATSCDEILSFKGDEVEFCTDILDRAKEANPNLIQSYDTGNVMDFCAGDEGGQDKDKGQGDRGQRRPSSLGIVADTGGQDDDSGQDEGGQDEGGQDEGGQEEGGQDEGGQDEGGQGDDDQGARFLSSLDPVADKGGQDDDSGQDEGGQDD